MQSSQTSVCQCSNEAGFRRFCLKQDHTGSEAEASTRIQELLKIRRRQIEQELLNLIGSFCQKRSSCSIRIFCYKEAPDIKTQVTTGAPVIKGAPVISEATAIPEASVTTEVQKYPAEVLRCSCSCFCGDQVQKLLLRFCFVGTLVGENLQFT